ncbi:aspartic proteinase-like protein 1 isoform X3 [Andrographis paniculata]|uniref:aspartic proteinase-like protein 1 isoform X3 n=1 Tax=Andrographis paniculata TaxID=175694 RepID=UPI0021E714D8|nr:aspartic proteinase-like protein 1 isoform X3 [Andrographis paniculata]
MEIPLIFLGSLITLCINGGLAGPAGLYSARLVHRFSDEARSEVLENGDGGVPEWRSVEYYRRLLSSDVKRQRVKMTPPQYQFMYPYEGSATLPLGNDFGWLHYVWIDLGMPKVSFLVALDSGSDLFWVPCDCVQCAPLSSNYYGSLDKNLNEYNPSGSSTSKSLSCNHQLCELGSQCPSPELQCPYVVNYYTDNTSTSGFLFEDILHLVSDHSAISNDSVKAPVIIGCGSKQTGSYLNGVAPDGLLGLGLGEISAPSLLAKAGYIRNSFSLCFKEDDSGRLFLGDQGLVDQQTTPFLSLDRKNLTYIVGVDACCIERSCLDQTNFMMLADSGTSFTFLPDKIYERVASEFDRQINASKTIFKDNPWEYCYNSSYQELPEIPSLTLQFKPSSSFVVSNPVFKIYGTEGAVGFCLAIQRTDEELGIIGQNFMTGYKIVFDRENFKLGWSRSSCEVLSDGDMVPGNSSGNRNSSNSSPQQSPDVVSGHTPSKSSAMCYFLCLANLIVLIFHGAYVMNL